MDSFNDKKTKEIYRDMAGLKCMSSLSPQAKTLLAGVGVKRIFKTGEMAWEMGDPGEFIVIIMSGLIEISRYSNRDEEMCMGIFGPSDVVGLSAVMKRTPYPGNAKILSAGTEVIKLYLRPVLQSRDPEVSEIHVWIREMFLLHEQVLRDKIDILNAGKIEDRVFELLNHLIRRFGQKDAKAHYRIPMRLTRAQVGRLVDSRVETIIRLLSRWQAADLVKWKADEILVPDLPLLEKSLNSKRGLK